MRYSKLALGMAAALVLSCAAAAADEHSLAVGGRERTYLLHRPAGLDRSRPVPLVVMLHGGFGSGSQAEGAYRWDEEADHRGFVVVYPDGVRRTWNAGGKCCGRAQRDNVDDVRFITRLIETVSRSENIDRSRVYVTGMSNGAAMAYRYACEGAFAVAAIGPVAGSFSYPCRNPHPVSVMEIHGLADTRVPFAGGHGNGVASGIDWLGVPATLMAFRRADDCPPAAPEKNGVVETTVWHCAAGREVVLITVAGAGHQWPGSARIGRFAAWLLRLDQPSAALDATDTLWSFFAAHRAG